MIGLEEGSTSIGDNLEDIVGELTLRKVLDESKIMEDEFVYRDRTYTLRYCFTKTDDKNQTGPEFRVVMYWLDHTDLDQLRIDLDNNKPAIMVIEIDGYEDVIKSTPEENQSLIRVDIEKIISRLEDETEGQIEKLANDKYILFTNKQAIKKLEKCKFPILDEAREIDRDNSLPVSLSVGVGYDGETIEETGHDVKILKKLKSIKYRSQEDKIYENHYFIGIDEGITNKKIEDKDKEEVEWHQFEEIEETLSYTYLKEFWKVIKNDVAKLLIENKDKRGK